MRAADLLHDVQEGLVKNAQLFDPSTANQRLLSSAQEILGNIVRDIGADLPRGAVELPRQVQAYQSSKDTGAVARSWMSKANEQLLTLQQNSAHDTERAIELLNSLAEQARNLANTVATNSIDTWA